MDAMTIFLRIAVLLFNEGEWNCLIGSKSDDSLDAPECRNAADAIRRNAPGPRRLRHCEASHDLARSRNDGEDGRDEQELSDLDADVEKEQRDGNR
jgi:hypothetical protein